MSIEDWAVVSYIIGTVGGIAGFVIFFIWAEDTDPFE